MFCNSIPGHVFGIILFSPKNLSVFIFVKTIQFYHNCKFMSVKIRIRRWKKIGHVPPRDGNNIRQNCTDLCTRRQMKTMHETNSLEQ